MESRQTGMPEALQVVLGIFGCLFVIGSLVGMAWASRVYKRPGANKKAVGSLALLLGIPWLAALIGVALRSSESAAGGVLSGLMILGGVASAVVLAIVGLLEIRREPARWTEGKGFAVATFCLAGLLVLTWVGMIGTIVATAVSRSGEARGPVKTDFPELGFRIGAPPASWRSANTGEINPKACMAYRRRNPEMYFMIVAEKIERDAGPTLQTVAGLVKANLVSGAQGAKVTLEEPESIEAMAGIRMQADVPQANGIVCGFRYWLHVSPDHVYQLIAWSLKGDEAAMLKEADALFDGFRTLPANE
jgi:hypothetical protein